MDEVVLDGRTALEDIVRARYARETPEAREVIDVLSCARTLPLSRLAQDVQPRCHRGHGRRRPDRRRPRRTGTSSRWATATSATSSATGSAWSAGWSCGTRFRGTSRTELNELTVEDLLAYAAWTHDCDAPAGTRPRRGGCQRRRQALRPEVCAQMRRQPVARRTRNGRRGSSRNPPPTSSSGCRCRPCPRWTMSPNGRSTTLGGRDVRRIRSRRRLDCMSWLEDRTGQVPELLRQARVRLQDLSLDEPAAAPQAACPCRRCAWISASSTTSPLSGTIEPMMERLTTAATTDVPGDTIRCTGSGRPSS